MADFVVREWDLEIDDHRFRATYFSSGYVEVENPHWGRKGTQAGASIPENVAKALAGKLIPKNA